MKITRSECGQKRKSRPAEDSYTVDDLEIVLGLREKCWALSEHVSTEPVKLMVQ